MYIRLTLTREDKAPQVEHYSANIDPVILGELAEYWSHYYDVLIELVD